MRKRNKAFIVFIIGALFITRNSSEITIDSSSKNSRKIEDAVLVAEVVALEIDTLLLSNEESVRLLKPLDHTDTVHFPQVEKTLHEPFPIERIPTTKSNIIKRTEIIDICGCSDPSFPGGAAMLNKFISSKINYPQEDLIADVQGRVYVGFVVEPDGKLTNIKVIRGVSPQIDAEAIRVIESMPDWIPAHEPRKGNQSTNLRIPINFQIAK